MKKCTGCAQTKELFDFYKHPATADGFASKCKLCAKAVVKAAREKRADHYAEYERSRANNPNRVAARAAYAKTEKGKAAHARALSAYQSRAPERRKAHISLGNAVRSGRVLKWPVCALPECNGKPEAHHPDYSRPLDVVWLCSAHHKQAHALVK